MANSAQSFNVFHAIKNSLVDYLPVMRIRKGVTRGSGQNIIAFLLVVLTTASCVATYAALNEVPPFGDDPDTVLWLLTLDLIFLLSLMVMVARRIAGLWSGRRRGLAGSHLHFRLIYIFSIMAAVPAIVMTLFSVFFFNFGLQSWFSERVQTAVTESQAVAQAYLEEHKQVIRADILAMANDIERQAGFFIGNKDALEASLQTQSFLRNFAEVVVFDTTGRVHASSGLTFTLEFEEIPAWALETADNGEVALLTASNEDRVRALIRLNNVIGTYLFVGRMVDPKVLSHLAATEKASQEYQSLQQRASKLQILSAMIFVIVGLLLMSAAIWLGFLLARQLVMPITDLIDAADRVREGDLSTQIAKRGRVEEFDYLAVAFNRMTEQIAEQQKELLDANVQLDKRRRFTETVLAGATSGIVGVDPKGKITLANTSASKLLNISEERLLGLKIRTVSPDTAELLDEAHKKPHKIAQKDITIQRTDIGTRIFLVSVAIELVDDESGTSKDVGAIITFDDITDLQSAQRKAAWSDVARRIAHEIKNPLTPIQLSAERLKRKYLKDIKEDPETFAQCTDTIIKHVEDIGHMVNEFSAFARMPEPTMQEEDLLVVVNSVINLHTHVNEHISMSAHYDDGNIFNAFVDAKQIRQALTNIIQNASDSVAAHFQNTQGGCGRVHVFDRHDDIIIAVEDNGVGLPEHTQEKQLLEPYVTHKTKGTGLGLAIVKKIMEDHKGDILLSPNGEISDILSRNINTQGACVCLVLPKLKQE
ncbi:MAG: ATP-binding protein [Bdellovibrionales bacterium]